MALDEENFTVSDEVRRSLDATNGETTPPDELWDESEEASAEPSFLSLRSPAAVRSFWLGCAGLAIICHLSMVAAIIGVDLIDDWIANTFFKMLGGPMLWALIEPHRRIVWYCICPGMILISVTAVLLWRGSLGQRSVVVFPMVVSGAATYMVWMRYFRRSSEYAEPGIALLGVIGCWLALPAIFLLPPFNRIPKLRLIAGVGLILLLACIEIASMQAFPMNRHMLGWLTLFSTGLLCALVARNMRNIVTFEANSDLYQYDKTSSKTMLELMAVCGLVFATVASWRIQVFSNELVANMLVAMVVALAVSVLSTWATCRWLGMSRAAPIPFLLLWIGLGLLFGSLGSIEMEYRYDWGLFDYAGFGDFRLINDFATGMVSSLILFGCLSLCGWWLRFCGWKLYFKTSHEVVK